MVKLECSKSCEDGVCVCNIRTVVSLNVILMNSFVGTPFQWSAQEISLAYLEKRFTKIAIFIEYRQCDMVKYELQVTSYELRVERLKARVESLKSRVEIQKCEFKSTSYEFESTSYEFKSTVY